VHTRELRLARVVVVVVLAVAGYLLFIRTPHVEHQLLRNLMVHRLSVHGLPAAPSIARSASPSTISVPVLRQAAKTDPDHTGVYELAWGLAKKPNAGLGMVLELLPDARDARTAFGTNVKVYVTNLQVSGSTLSERETFSIPSLPQARAESYAVASSATKAAAGYVYAVVFRMDRAVVVELMRSLGTRSTSDAISVTTAEHAVLQRAEPGFSMVRTPTPVVASVVFWVVAILVAAAAFFVPEWAPDALSQRRARHKAKELENARSQYRARGRRAVRRHRAPAWRQPRRR
jgi:hypothetical protein